MQLRTIMGLVAAAAVALWFVDDRREDWYMGLALFGALIIPPRLAWKSTRWVIAGPHPIIPANDEVEAYRRFLTDCMIFFLVVWYGLAAITFFIFRIIRSILLSCGC